MNWKLKPQPPQEFINQFPEYKLHLLQLLWDRGLKTQAAIDEFFGFSGGEKWAYDIRRVKESILAQKEKSKTKPEREEK